MNGWCGSRKETVRFLALWKGIRGVHRRRDPQKLWGSDQTVDRGCGFWRQKGFNGKKKVDFVGLWIVEDDDADVFRVPRISLFFSERDVGLLLHLLVSFFSTLLLLDKTQSSLRVSSSIIDFVY